MAIVPDITLNIKPRKPHVTAIWILSIVLLLSLGGNVYQNNLRKNEKTRALLDMGEARVLIAMKQGQILQRDSLISTIRKERSERTAKDSVSMAGLKTRLATLQGKLTKLPTTVKYNPDSATVDSLRTAFVLKDSVIDTQALMIMNLETEKQGLFASFTREIDLITSQRADQVAISNSLQTQLVDEQGKTRKSERWRKFWKRTTGAVVVAAAAVVTIVTLKE